MFIINNAKITRILTKITIVKILNAEEEEEIGAIIRNESISWHKKLLRFLTIDLFNHFIKI